MNIFSIGFGKFLAGLSTVISFILDVLITVTEVFIGLIANLAKGFLALISMGGCLILFFLMGPLGLFFLLNPVVILTILFFILVPILGTKLISYLKYMKYTLTEYLNDRSNYFISGNENFKSFQEYGNKYWRMEEERRRKEQERRRAEQQRQWEERFSQWSQYQNSQRGSGYGGYYTGGAGSTYVNPTSEFKEKFEKSCDILGVPYNTDEYEVRLAYRKKAKEYHPDINKSPNATEMFQKINDAYEFLSQGNIERYKNLN